MKMFDVYPVYPIEVVRGQGCWIWDKNGNKYLDCYGGHAVISIGHSHPHFVDLVSKQLRLLAFYSNSVENPLQADLAKALASLSGLDEYRLFLVNSGAEANENALKLASFHNGRTGVISFTKGFHGRTSAAANVTDSNSIAAPINKGFRNIQLEINDYDALDKAIDSGEISSVIIEGIQGIGGINCIDVEFLQHIRTKCDQTDTILILDEIQSGYGRSGHFFAFQKDPNLRPDIISMAKGMGNGFPIGGLLIGPKFTSQFGLLGTTFGGNHLACSAGLAVLEVIESEQLIDHAHLLGKESRNALRQRLPDAMIRGEGLMIGIEIKHPVKDIRKQLLFEDHVFVGSSSNPNVIRLLPPLTITPDEMSHCIDRLVARLS